MAHLVPMPEEIYSKAMAQRMLAQRQGALEQLRRWGAGVLDVPASALTVATVNRYLDLKAGEQYPAAGGDGLFMYFSTIVLLTRLYTLLLLCLTFVILYK